jgi:hypothetical protein
LRDFRQLAGCQVARLVVVHRDSERRLGARASSHGDPALRSSRWSRLRSAVNSAGAVKATA